MQITKAQINQEIKEVVEWKSAFRIVAKMQDPQSKGLSVTPGEDAIIRDIAGDPVQGQIIQISEMLQKINFAKLLAILELVITLLTYAKDTFVKKGEYKKPFFIIRWIQVGKFFFNVVKELVIYMVKKK